MSGTPPFNLMALLAAAQQPGMRGVPASGPIPAQSPVPGFRPPGVGGMPMPQMQQPQDPMAGAAGLGAAMGRMRPTGPGAQPSTSGATMGAAENNGLAGVIAGVQGIQPNADGTFSPPPMPTDIGYGQGGGGGFLDFLTGKMRSLFGPSSVQ